MFVTPAFAQTAAAPAGGLIGSFLPLILIFVIMYFLIFRPQRQAMKKREAMLAAVKRGDEVVTGGGLVGKITHVDDEKGEVDVDLGGGTKVRAVRAMLADVRTKEKPAEREAPANDETTSKVKSRTRP